MLKSKLLLLAARVFYISVVKRWKYRQCNYPDYQHMINNTETQLKILTKDCEPEQLQWTALMKSIAMGTAADVCQELSALANLAARDYWKRTPWLLSIHTGDVEKSQILWAAAIDPTDKGHCGKTALMLATESGNLAMITAGNNPGWIYEHCAEYLESGVIVISGGSIEDAKESKENSIKYQLDLETLVWK
jgi:hypothetical protein